MGDNTKPNTKPEENATTKSSPFASFAEAGDEDATARLNMWLDGSGAQLAPPPPPPATLHSAGGNGGSRDTDNLEPARRGGGVESYPPLHPTRTGGATPPKPPGVLRHTSNGSKNSSEDAVAPSSNNTKPKGHNRTVSWGDYNPNAKVEGQSSATAPTTVASPTLPTIHSVVGGGDQLNYSSSTLQDLDTGTSGGDISPLVTSMGGGETPPQSPDLLSSSQLNTSPRGSWESSVSGESSRLRGVNLADIVKSNPLESEAETLILKAIEKQDQITTQHRRDRSRANTGTSSALLSNIPDEAVNIFTSNDTSTPAGPLPGVVASQTAETSSEDEGRGKNHNPSVRRLLSRKTSSGGRASAASAQMQKQALPPKPNHKRHLTMEETLAGLTVALAEIHGDEAVHADAKHPADQQVAAIDTKMASSGETLAKNANLVFRGRQKTESKAPVDQNTRREDNGAASSSSAAEEPERPSGNVNGKSMAARNWAKLRTVVAVSQMVDTKQKVTTADQIPNWNPDISVVPGSVNVHKKTDNVPSIHEEDEDEEEGLATSGSFDENKQNANGIGNGDGGTLRQDKKRRKTLFKSKKGHHGVIKDFEYFLVERRLGFFSYLRFYLLLLIPITGTAFILYYASDNPPTGRVDLSQSTNATLVNENGDVINPAQASVSWWLIFVLRQTITFSLACGFQVFIVDFLCLSTRVFLSIFGNFFTLLIVQSKGGPFILFFWGLFNFALLHGPTEFVEHWLFYQDVIGIFNAQNPSGYVLNNDWNTRCLAVAVCIGAVVAFKRLWLGLYLGRKTVANYAEELTKVIHKILLLSQVAELARRILQESFNYGTRGPASTSEFGMTREEYQAFFIGHSNNDDGSSFGKGSSGSVRSKPTSARRGLILDPNEMDPTGSLNRSQRMKLIELLGDWEEPELEIGVNETISISSILQFRQSLAFLDSDFMFSIAWGDVSNRDNMIRSSQEVFRRLCLRGDDPNTLNFEIITLVATQADGSLDREKLKQLIRLLRPDRDGNLTLLDFVKSVDAVYKAARLLRASVRNSSKIDRAFELIINICFYIVLMTIVLGVMGLNPLAMFLSLSSIIVAFAFMIGAASSKMFEGWLFILGRRPYDIGDRIHVSNVEEDTNPNGSSGWIVQDVTLMTTTVVFATTNEKATLSNGSLANSRVINMARSPNAVLYVHLKFSTSVPYARVQVFEQALRQFIKARPREWASLNGFRATQVQADLGYIEYVVVLQHREAWQNVAALLVSKAQVSSFCLELSKKLEMRYESPPLPVDLAVVQRGGRDDESKGSVLSKFAGFGTDDAGFRELAAQFENTK